MPTPNPATAVTALPELTLIVAATQQMGIGRNGSLPWTGLKREMAYFARVTKRLPPFPTAPPVPPVPATLSAVPNPGSSSAPVSGTALPVSSSVSSGVQGGQQNVGQGLGQPAVGTGTGIGGGMGGLQNAVIMGRKTWESIPEKFRPLPGRLNVVISRSVTSTPLLSEGKGGKDGVVMAGSLEEALRYLKGRLEGTGLGRVFVIGGAQIYRAALEAKEARRVLLTRVRSEFECDTFFPLRLEEGAEGERGWKRSAQEEMDQWVGEEVPRGVQSENGTEYEFEMWERVD